MNNDGSVKSAFGNTTNYATTSAAGITTRFTTSTMNSGPGALYTSTNRALLVQAPQAEAAIDHIIRNAPPIEPIEVAIRTRGGEEKAVLTVNGQNFLTATGAPTERIGTSGDVRYSGNTITASNGQSYSNINEFGAYRFVQGNTGNPRYTLFNTSSNEVFNGPGQLFVNDRESKGLYIEDFSFRSGGRVPNVLPGINNAIVSNAIKFHKQDGTTTVSSNQGTPVTTLTPRTIVRSYSAPTTVRYDGPGQSLTITDGAGQSETTSNVRLFSDYKNNALTTYQPGMTAINTFKSRGSLFLDANQGSAIFTSNSNPQVANSIRQQIPENTETFSYNIRPNSKNVQILSVTRRNVSTGATTTEPIQTVTGAYTTRVGNLQSVTYRNNVIRVVNSAGQPVQTLENVNKLVVNTGGIPFETFNGTSSFPINGPGTLSYNRGTAFFTSDPRLGDNIVTTSRTAPVPTVEFEVKYNFSQFSSNILIFPKMSSKFLKFIQVSLTRIVKYVLIFTKISAKFGRMILLSILNHVIRMVKLVIRILVLVINILKCVIRILKHLRSILKLSLHFLQFLRENIRGDSAVHFECTTLPTQPDQEILYLGGCICVYQQPITTTGVAFDGSTGTGSYINSTPSEVPLSGVTSFKVYTGGNIRDITTPNNFTSSGPGNLYISDNGSKVLFATSNVITEEVANTIRGIVPIDRTINADLFSAVVDGIYNSSTGQATVLYPGGNIIYSSNLNGTNLALYTDEEINDKMFQNVSRINISGIPFIENITLDDVKTTRKDAVVKIGGDTVACFEGTSFPTRPDQEILYSGGRVSVYRRPIRPTNVRYNSNTGTGSYTNGTQNDVPLSGVTSFKVYTGGNVRDITTPNNFTFSGPGNLYISDDGSKVLYTTSNVITEEVANTICGIVPIDITINADLFSAVVDGIYNSSTGQATVLYPGGNIIYSSNLNGTNLALYTDEEVNNKIFRNVPSILGVTKTLPATNGGTINIIFNGRVIYSYTPVQNNREVLVGSIENFVFNGTALVGDDLPNGPYTGINNVLLFDGIETKIFNSSDASKQFVGPGLLLTKSDSDTAFYTTSPSAIQFISAAIQTQRRFLVSPELRAPRERKVLTKQRSGTFSFGQDVTAFQGADITLRCRVARGNPDPNFSFFRGNMMLNGTTQGVIIANDTLTLTDVAASDSGDYRCVASNGVPPIDTLSTKLTVKNAGKP